MITPLPPKHIAQITPLFREVQALHAACLADLFHTRATDADFAAHLAREFETGARLLGAWHDDTLMAFLLWQIEDRAAEIFKNRIRRARLDVIGVAAAHRRLGLGLELIQRMEQDMRARDLTQWIVNCYAFNTASASLMARAGAAPSLHCALRTF